MDPQELLEATIDTELLALLAQRGPYVSNHLVFSTVRACLPAAQRTADDYGRPTALGHKVLWRWDHIRKEWGL